MAERVNARLKDEFGGRTLRVGGASMVMAHLMFGVIALTVVPIQKHLRKRIKDEAANKKLSRLRQWLSRHGHTGPVMPQRANKTGLDG